MDNTKIIIDWLEGLIRAKDNFGQQGGTDFNYVLGYIASAEALLAVLRQKV